MYPQSMFWAKVRKISFLFLQPWKIAIYIAWACFRNVPYTAIISAVNTVNYTEGIIFSNL